MIKTVLVAQETPWMRNTAHVKLHGISIDPNRDGSIVDKPLGQEIFILGEIHGRVDGHSNFASVEGAFLVQTVIFVI